MHVTLDRALAEVEKPSAIAQTSKDVHGTSKVGVQKHNIFAEKPLTSPQEIQVEDTKTEIPKTFIGTEILAVEKSAQVSRLAITPELLATTNPAPENPGNKEKPYAPTASVAKPMAVAPAAVEKLVSSEPVPGERQEKIVFAGTTQEKLPAEKPGNLADPAKPVPFEKPEPTQIEKPKSVKIEAPKPVEAAQAQPAEIEKTQPLIDGPKPAKVAEPAPAKIGENKPEHKPANSGAEIKTRPAEARNSDVFRAGTPAYKLPSLAELNIFPVKKFASDRDKKIKFGERKKTVSIKEQDIRYAMYVESVRLKLQRIGMFNYPAEAAKGNLSGTLSVIITLRADGSLGDFQIIEPSLYEVFNQGAERIVKMSAPFSPFPDNLRQDTDVLGIKINWSFSNASQSFD